MARVEHVTGIILERRPLLEHDRRLIVWTRETGKLELVAKGTQKIESKLAGSLEPLTEVRLSLTRGRTDRVISSSIVQSWPGIRNELKALAAASFAVQAVSRLTQVGLPDSALFNLLRNCLSSLNEQAADKHSVIVRKFLWRLFERLGFRPRLDACVRCNKPLPDGGYYSAVDGGLVGAECRAQAPDSFLVSPQAVAELNALMSDDCSFKLHDGRTAVRVINQTLLNHLTESLPAEKFWRRMNKE